MITIVKDEAKNKMLVSFTSYLIKKGLVAEGQNPSRIVYNYLLGKDKVKTDVKDRPKIVRELSQVNCQLGTLEKQMDLIAQQREDLMNRLREIDEEVN